MQIELFITVSALAALKRDNVAAPLYRLPIAMFSRAVPKLVGEGLLSIDEVGALVEYVNRVEELNRGLDRAGAAHAAGRATQLTEEFERNLAKAEGFSKVERRFYNQSLYDASKDAVYRLDEEFSPLQMALPWDGMSFLLTIPRIVSRRLRDA
jgi:hypothetical protein